MENGIAMNWEYAAQVQYKIPSSRKPTREGLPGGVDWQGWCWPMIQSQWTVKSVISITTKGTVWFKTWPPTISPDL